jgi:hypothetical protein
MGRLFHRLANLTELVETDSSRSRQFVHKNSEMTPCEHQIVEYTNSELRAHGVPFIVILRLHMQDGYKLTGYVLQNSEAKIDVASGPSAVMSKPFWGIFVNTVRRRYHRPLGSLIA